ncbi:glycosyltransferase family 2 protein [Krasilnikovia sp. MM14-A1259]|uniref:glycosyltransferase family 2 protein n=1 Tax=Krasilnikovia sp. MM14-A1259 TaxID=3373539 RepID=UPI00381D0119
MTASTVSWLVLALSLLIIPVTSVLIDRLAWISARVARRAPAAEGVPVEDFDVLVPIYGSVSYLENVDYLAQYGDRVVLCTTGGESGYFYAAIAGLARRHGFRIFRAESVAGGAGGNGRRATSGTIRDRLVREALEHAVTRPYVVCVDADTTTERPLGELVGAMAAHGYDFASVPLVPANTSGMLERLQAYEYRTAMNLRRIAPWQVSGACHVARTEVHRAVMRRHSMFFQGNDVEAGLLATALGYRVGHLPFPVLTTVPNTLRSWWRQRLAWSGGEFRLFAVNAQLLLRHPFFWVYGTLLVTLGTPLRWLSLAAAGRVLLIVLVLHTAVTTYAHWRQRTRWLALMPLYTLVTSLVLTPLGVLWYIRMAWADRNAGLIRAQPRRRRIPAEQGTFRPDPVAAVGQKAAAIPAK